MVSTSGVAVVAAGTSSGNASSRASPAIVAAAGGVASSKTKAPQVNSNGYHPSSQMRLSAMQNPPLDITSVERRGQPTAVREPLKKKSRPHGLEEAPTYCPTEEEWKDPMEYMRKITPEASKYGLCKIIPPDSWNPEFAIDTERFHFRTRKQELNSVEGSTRANLSYLDGLFKFHKQQGNNLHRLPYVDKKPLELFKLKKAVEARGGFDKVCKHKKWAEIGRDLGYSGKIMSSLSTSLKNSYQRWLCPYEDYLRVAKPGVHHQLELEYGGPLTPSPAPTPVKRSTANTPQSHRGDSPARQATDALQSSINGSKTEPDRDTPMPDAPAPAPAPAVVQGTSSGGFRAINSGGGFTAVNSGFTSVNRSSAAAESKVSTPQKQLGSAQSSAKNTPEYRPSGLGQAVALKRQSSTESSSDSMKKEPPEDDDIDNGSRRSKRLKKEAVPTVAGSHMSLFRPSIPRLPRDECIVYGSTCDQCGKNDDANSLLICDSCDHSYHSTCLDPPLKHKPESGWNCPRCLVGDGQFGFEEGGLYSLKQFQQKANEFKQAHFEKRMPMDPVLNCPRPVTEEDVENEFWRLVADIEETVEVEYGADIHCTTHGSGFPTFEKEPTNPYSLDPWNLNLLPLHPDSLFRHIKSDISGMTVPWVYVGMIFSTFCWHNEDHYAYSANYQHFGATKTWYGIPGEDAEKFEAAMRDAVPELFETQPDLLFQLVTLLTPEHLKKAGVRVYAVDQRAGQFVITFPQAYHAGFNHGFNFNEAVNFAPCDWEPFGLAGVERLQQFRRQPCFSHDELLWTAAEGTTSGALTIQTAKWLAPALERIIGREESHREDFITKHKESSTHDCPFDGSGRHADDRRHSCPLQFEVSDAELAEEEYQCAYCKAFSFLSRFQCLTSGKTLCLLHAGTYACCDAPEKSRFLGEHHMLIYKKDHDTMATAHKRVMDKAMAPELWEEKYEKLLEEEAEPSLKALRLLLHEGDRIPYDLPSLPVLRDFVDRCNEWVEEAANFTLRKQQNRRKNEKAWQSGKRKSIGGPTQDQKEREARDVSNIARLLEEADHLGFDCPEILQLRERADAIAVFRTQASELLKKGQNQSPEAIEAIEDLLDEGRGFNVDMEEIDRLTRVLDQAKWHQQALDSRKVFMSLDDVIALIEEGKRLEMPPYDDQLRYFMQQMSEGKQWEKKARELISADIVHYAQLEALSAQVQRNALPVTQETLARVDQILLKQREAHRHIVDLTEKCRDPDFRKRPKYTEVCEIMKKLEDLNSKPNGTVDLEREQKRHEDWMRQGKKLFGKTNAPLHILKVHLDHVLERNTHCFDIIHDKPRDPAEPASREPSPGSKQNRWEDPSSREVFCICRRIEAGMMIECGICHEWYHGKCLKIARGKVKDDEQVLWTCPICDHRVKIPRDAARPKLGDLIAWYEEIPSLPFQPEEEEVLKQIIDNAQSFRKHIEEFVRPLSDQPRGEAETERFYLRKIEGAEILLVEETNYFRQELYKWCNVTHEPPPITQESKSTRKPRPTKLQKLLAEFGVEDPDDLPEPIRGKANSLRRKAKNLSIGSVNGMASSSSPTGTHSPGSQTISPSLHPMFSKHRAPTTSGFGRGDSPPEPLQRGDAMELDESPRVGLPPSGHRLRGSDGDGQIDLPTGMGKKTASDTQRSADERRRDAELSFGPDVWAREGPPRVEQRPPPPVLRDEDLLRDFPRSKTVRESIEKDKNGLFSRE